MKIDIIDSGADVAEQFIEMYEGGFKIHMYNIYCQHSELKYLEQNLKENQAIFSVDFSKNYEINKKEDSKCLLWSQSFHIVYCSLLF